MQEKIWFRAKRYGYGWYPAAWQGWAVLAMYVFAVFSSVIYVNNHEFSVSDFTMQFFPSFCILTVFFVIICYETGEKPYWRWRRPKEELLDVLNERGEKTGEIAPRSKVHKLGLWHLNAHVYIINSKNEILLQLRSKTKESNPNRWGGSAGGHVEAGQGSFETAKRETKEELGLSLSDSELTYVGTSRDHVDLNGGTYKNYQFNDVYVIQKDVALSELQKQESEVADIRWVLIEAFRQRVADKDESIVPCASIPIFFTYYDNLK